MNVVEFVYCCFYRWSEQINGKSYPNRHSASMMMSFELMLVAGAIFSAAVSVFGIDLSGPLWRIGAMLFCVLLYVVVHRIFGFGDRLDNALRDFDASDRGLSRSPGLVVALVVGSTLVLLFATWFWIAKA